MQVEIKTHLDGEPLVVHMPDGDGMWLQCEVTAPPSNVGRSVNVYIARDLVPKVMKELRHSAIQARRRPIPSARPVAATPPKAVGKRRRFCTFCGHNEPACVCGQEAYA